MSDFFQDISKLGNSLVEFAKSYKKNKEDDYKKSQTKKRRPRTRHRKTEKVITPIRETNNDENNNNDNNFNFGIQKKSKNSHSKIPKQNRRKQTIKNIRRRANNSSNSPRLSYYQQIWKRDDALMEPFSIMKKELEELRADKKESLEELYSQMDRLKEEIKSTNSLEKRRELVDVRKLIRDVDVETPEEKEMKKSIYARVKSSGLNDLKNRPIIKELQTMIPEYYVPAEFEEKHELYTKSDQRIAHLLVAMIMDYLGKYLKQNTHMNTRDYMMMIKGGRALQMHGIKNNSFDVDVLLTGNNSADQRRRDAESIIQDMVSKMKYSGKNIQVHLSYQHHEEMNMFKIAYFYRRNEDNKNEQNNAVALVDFMYDHPAESMAKYFHYSGSFPVSDDKRVYRIQTLKMNLLEKNEIVKATKNDDPMRASKTRKQMKDIEKKLREKK